jgi:anthranilate synthase component 1
VTLDVSREAFVDHAEADRPVVVRAAAALDADIEPLSAYAALSGRTSDAESSEYTFLLESAEKVASSDPDGAFAPETDDRHARFSFVGYDPRAVVTITGDDSRVEAFDERYADLVGTGGDDVVDSLRAAMPDVELRGFPEMQRQHLEGGLVGFLAYDAVYDLWLDEVGMERPDSRFPDAQFVLSTATLRFDHLEERVHGRPPDEKIEPAEDRQWAGEASRGRQVALYFFPGGHAQEAQITLSDDLEGERTLTIRTAPLTGETFVDREIPELPVY